YDGLIASITLAGSIVSSVSTACVLTCFVIYRRDQRSFRHALVLNLALSDFINSFTNSISGIIYVRNHRLVPGHACTFNGWIEQLSVQATDFSILAIGLATLLVVVGKGHLSQASTARKALICLSVWIVPFITSTTVTAMGEVKPVSGNWCWISQKRTDLRYGLTHGWRIVIILVTIGTYTYIWWYMHRHFKSMGSTLSVSNKENRGEAVPVSSESLGLEPTGQVRMTFDISANSETHLPVTPNNSPRPTSSGGGTSLDTPQYTHDSYPTSAPSSKSGRDPFLTRKFSKWSSQDSDPNNTVLTTINNDHLRRQSRQAERDIRRMLLLNGYPIMYVILWVPSLVNRVMEATGQTSSSNVLAILQCPPQYVGFANAITYGLNLFWRDRL
ncbi:G protein-coupled glucose receptor regulating Gpa2-domain-containing protein, partial [Pseudomassariella vexata]